MPFSGVPCLGERVPGQHSPAWAMNQALGVELGSCDPGQVPGPEQVIEDRPAIVVNQGQGQLAFWFLGDKEPACGASAWPVEPVDPQGQWFAMIVQLAVPPISVSILAPLTWPSISGVPHLTPLNWQALHSWVTILPPHPGHLWGWHSAKFINFLRLSLYLPIKWRFWHCLEQYIFSLSSLALPVTGTGAGQPLHVFMVLAPSDSLARYRTAPRPPSQPG